VFSIKFLATNLQQLASQNPAKKLNKGFNLVPADQLFQNGGSFLSPLQHTLHDRSDVKLDYEGFQEQDEY
jgi:hypothetical protein